MTENMQALKKEVIGLREEKEQLFAKQKELSTKISEFINKLKVHKESRDKLTTQVRDGKQKREEINEQIRKLIAEVKSLQGTSSSSKPAERGLSPGKLKKEIQGIQKTIETAAVSFEKEKELMKVLKEKQKQFDKFSEGFANRDKVKEVDKKLKGLKKDSDDVHEVVQDSAKRSQEEHESMLKLSAEIDALRAAEKEIREKISPLKETIREKSKVLDEFYKENKERFEAAKKVSLPKRPKVDMAAQRKKVEDKLAKGGKLTTEDLLVMQTAEDKPIKADVSDEEIEALKERMKPKKEEERVEFGDE